MKMCDRCRVPGCLLDYNGKACANARKEHCPDVVFTNADHIRSMSDEELKVYLCYISDCAMCLWQSSSGCKLEDWLKQPYEGAAE